MKRDTQRSKVYRSENYLAWREEPISQDEVRSMIERILDDRKVRARWGAKDVAVRFYGNRNHGARTDYFGTEVTFSAASSTPMIVCHELAHALAPVGEGHGPEFASTYLFLVGAFVGTHEAKVLRQRFRDNRVKVAAAPKVKPGPIPMRKRDRERVVRSERKRQVAEERAARLRQIEDWLTAGDVSVHELDQICKWYRTKRKVAGK